MTKSEILKTIRRIENMAANSQHNAVGGGSSKEELIHDLRRMVVEANYIIFNTELN